MNRDELDELGRRLFESVASEQPSSVLRARVLAAARVQSPSALLPLALHPRQLDDERDATSDDCDATSADCDRRDATSADRDATSPALRARGRRPGLGRARWLLAAAALMVLPIVLLRVLRSRTDGAPRIAAESTLARSRAADRAKERASTTTEAPFAERVQPSGSERSPSRGLRLRESSERTASPAPSAPASPAAASSAAPDVRAASLAEQLDWLKRARALLRSGDSEGALRLLDDYAQKRFPADLNAEAALLRVEALASAGRVPEAASLARRFVGENPNNPLVERARTFFSAAPVPASESNSKGP